MKTQILKSLMKFKKFNERIDLLSKATEKSNATVLNLRRLHESLNFQSYMQSYKDYSGSVTESYRDALDCYERALYPHEHDKYMKEAVKIANNNKEYEKKQEDDIEKLLTKTISYPNNIQLDSPDKDNSSNKIDDKTEENIVIDINENRNKDLTSKQKKSSKVIEMAKNMNELYKDSDINDEDKQKLKP